MSMYPTGDDDWSREVREDTVRAVLGVVLGASPFVLAVVGIVSVAIDAVT